MFANSFAEKSVLLTNMLAFKGLRIVALAVLASFMVACGSVEQQQSNVKSNALLEAVQSSEVEGFAQLGPIYAGGLPSLEELNSFADKGVKTVIDFRRPQEGLEQEQAELAKLGVNYVNIPLGRELAPAEAQEKFAQAFAAAKGEKVLLHCRSGNRVGMVWSLYQINQGVDVELAIEQGRAMGMKSGFEKAVRASLTKE
ncbi:sulfur transferase domain-containing protein [uncultured Pseudoteredinibacter sp.]|uniref:fused DSP-PTPase phosphatase/NAD kinase-like protein n=1 Tax=uncultured Pseudoteredinibacter sp. TaxID=1641701 RepID=UPI0026320312|nr:sulfur transferase domain-containing protein [uncultured Pseudoteredinibacter sp.]